jgi:hypothetical protein
LCADRIQRRLGDSHPDLAVISHRTRR